VKPRFFASPAAFTTWMERHHARARELLVGYYKVGSGRPSLTWSESVDVALCYGWIDGVRRSIDATRYMIRFTPRKPRSNWSSINIRKVAELEAAGRMRPAGRAAFAAREAGKRAPYSFEHAPHELAPEYLRRLRADARAWAFFQAAPPSYRRVAAFWVMSAKQPATRERRLKGLITASAAGLRASPFRVRRGAKG